MPAIANDASSGVLVFGTAAVTEPMSFYDASQQVVGLDVEFALRIAAKLNKRLEVVNLEFGAMLPALIAGKVDMIGAGLSITEERAKSVLFSESYYESGIAALVRLPEDVGKDVADGKTHHAANQQEDLSGSEVDSSFLIKLVDGFHNNIIREKRYMMIIRGLMIIIIISIFAALTGTLLGGVVCFMRMSKSALLRTIASYYISLIRGTPVLVLLMIIYYVVFASVNINPVMVAVIAFGINFAAYVSEMFRTSIQSVDRGQKEAGIASGFTKVQTIIYIILPQAMRQVLPVYKGEFISLVKMTSIVGYIAVEDLTKASDIITSRTFDAFFPLIMAAVIYIFIAWLLTLILDHIEVGVDPVRRRLRARREVVK